MRLWARHGIGDAAVDEFEMYMRLLGWRKKAGYHREARKPECAAGPGSNSTPHRNPNQAREGEHAFSSTVYVLRLEHEEHASEEND